MGAVEEKVLAEFITILRQAIIEFPGEILGENRGGKKQCSRKQGCDRTFNEWKKAFHEFTSPE